MTELTSTQMTQNHLAWAKQQPEIGRCAFCPEYRVEGTAEEVVKLNAEHHQTAHPEKKWKPKRRGVQTQLLVLRQNLDETEVSDIEAERRRRAKLHGVELD